MGEFRPAESAVSVQPVAPPGGAPALSAWRIVAFLWLAFVINYMDRQILFSVFPLLRTDLRLSSTQLGFAGSTFTWMYCLSIMPAGWVADRFRRDRLIISTLVLWSGATLG